MTSRPAGRTSRTLLPLPCASATATHTRQRATRASSRGELYWSKVKRSLISLPIYSEALGYGFDANGIACIDCGGKDQIDRLYRVFNELGIACYVLFDYDKDNAEAVKASKKLLNFLGYPKDHELAKPLLTEKFACFLKTWEEDVNGQILNQDQLAADARKLLGCCSKPLTARLQLTSTS